MTRILAKALGLLLGLALGSVAASANTMVSIQPGNDNATNVNAAVFDNDPALFLVSKWEGSEGFEGPEFNVSGSDTSGTWSINGVPGFENIVIFAVAIKAGPNFILVDYTMDNGVLADNWCTDGTCTVNDGSGGDLGPLGSLEPPISLTNPQGGALDISHVSLYGIESIPPIPEPAAWLMMIAGFAVMGLVIRRRQMPTMA